ncbi:MAG: hypothetical protein US35_C0022G0034 [Parcubacteria group bacterium GW2011_GWA2_37_10]|nr:MAG: hypothetical protein US35_C0022G0034 [Parcubacteria group bacterium GW2011_GWA2_37_10]
MKDSAIEQILLHLYDSIDFGSSYGAKKMFGIEDLFPNSNWKKFKKEEIHDGF